MGVLICVLTVVSVQAQTPQFINYQAVARNTETGEELANQSIFLSAKILSNGPNGDIIYQEEHSETATNAFGLFSLHIGGGNPISGSFSQIDWSSGTHWLELDMEIDGSLQTIGAMQFVSVPYALYAETTGNVDDADADPNNERISNTSLDLDNMDLTITEGGVGHSVDLSPLINDADADPSNETISNFSFNESTSELAITEAGVGHLVDLSGVGEDDDPDPSNELITGMSLDQDSGILSVTEAGEVTEVSLLPMRDDADADPTNEKISDITFSSANNVLTVVEGAASSSVDLSSLADDGDWEKSDDGSVVFTTSSKVGVGTNNPQSTFQVNGSIGYGYTILQAGLLPSSYSILEDDYIIICKTDGLLNLGPLTVEMPNPTTCPGRVITVKRTGNGLLYATLFVDFIGYELDYSSTTLAIAGPFDRRSMTFISIGADGWIQIMDSP